MLPQLSTKGKKGQGYGPVPSAWKYAQKLKLQAEIEGRNRNTMARDVEVAHNFTQRPEVAP
jgi:hypothetical protein